MSKKTGIFDDPFKELKRLLEKGTLGSDEVKQAELHLRQLKRAHNKLRIDYHEKLKSNAFLKKLLKSKDSKKRKKNNLDLRKMTSDYCFKKLKDFLNASKRPEKSNEETANEALKCLNCLGEIHDSLNSHFNACKIKFTCQTPKTKVN